jgi:hypothetical protein
MMVGQNHGEGKKNRRRILTVEYAKHAEAANQNMRRFELRIGLLDGKNGNYRSYGSGVEAQRQRADLTGN